MPIEDEWKFVLFSKKSERAISTSSLPPPLLLEQSYLEPSTRVRKVISGLDTKHFFTWKRKLLTGKPIEIEPQISVADYEMLKEECYAGLAKKRWELPETSWCGGKWDMDAFLDENALPCFWMAEVETYPENEWKMDRVHPMLDGLIAWAVPKGHPAFFNYALSQEGGIDRAKAIVTAEIGSW